MGEYREVRHERLYLKEPGTERLRKGSAARLKHMLATGWRETERWYSDRFITARVERSGVDPAIGKMHRSHVQVGGAGPLIALARRHP